MAADDLNKAIENTDLMNFFLEGVFSFLTISKSQEALKFLLW
jgi:hypothetical protein